eukprot:291008_1
MYEDEYSMSATFFDYLFFVQFEYQSNWSEFLLDVNSYKILSNLKYGQTYLTRLRQPDLLSYLAYLPEAVSNYRNELFYKLYMNIQAEKEETEIIEIMHKLQPY